MASNFLSSILSSLWTKEVIFSFFAAFGGGVLLWGLWLEFKEEKKPKKEWFSEIGEYRDRHRKRLYGEKWVIAGVAIEIIVAIVFAVMDVREKYNIGEKIDPNNLPVLNINAFVKLRVKGNEFPDLTHWNSVRIATNWGSRTATAMLCGNDPSRVLSSSIPTLFTDDFGTGSEHSDSREYFLNFRMESISAALNLPMQSASKSLKAADLFRIDANFLPPQSEIMDGYAFVVINNSLWKLFRIYPQKDTQPSFENEAKTWSLLSVTNLSQVKWQFVETGDSNAIAHSTIRINEPGKVTVISNAEPVLAFPHGHLESRVEIIGTNVPSGKFDPNW
jgi:hypothetical protein